MAVCRVVAVAAVVPVFPVGMYVPAYRGTTINLYSFIQTDTLRNSMNLFIIQALV